MTAEPSASVEDVAKHFGVARDSVRKLPAHKPRPPLGEADRERVCPSHARPRIGTARARAIGEEPLWS